MELPWPEALYLWISAAENNKGKAITSMPTWGFPKESYWTMLGTNSWSMCAFGLIRSSRDHSDSCILKKYFCQLNPSRWNWVHLKTLISFVRFSLWRNETIGSWKPLSLGVQNPKFRCSLEWKQKLTPPFFICSHSLHWPLKESTWPASPWPSQKADERLWKKQTFSPRGWQRRQKGLHLQTV